jgi:hypothetical protein
LEIEPYYLYSIRQQSSYTWKKILCELIDNSFDANASRVDLAWPGGKVFKISDDGNGTSDLTRMVTLGKRFESDSNDVGKYGVGCKHALIWLWGTSRITSMHDNVSREICMDWESIAKGIDSYPGEQSIVEKPSKGTLIECFSNRCYPAFEDVLRDISATYTPGLELGKSIFATIQKRQGRKLTPIKWPKCDEEVFDTIEAAGRTLSVRMGIVEEGTVNPYEKGFSFERKYRSIKASLLGANGYAVSRVAARITLGKEWELSTNKDDFSEFEDELEEAIQDRFGYLMQKASTQTISIEEDEFNNFLGAIASASGDGTRRENRKHSENNTGSVEPKSTGRKRTNAEKSSDEPGSVLDDSSKASKRRSGYTVDTYTDPDGSLEIGYYDESAKRVRLNMANPWLKEKYAARVNDALIPIIKGILAQAEQYRFDKAEPLFLGKPKEFATRWGETIVYADGKANVL